MKARPKPDPIDVRVGQKVKARRLELGLSQTALADSLDVTFQQVQKYENGRNRISASRLSQISRFLKVPESHFFEFTGPPDADEESKTFASFAASKEGIALARAMAKIKRKRLRQMIVKLVDDLADACSAAD